MGVRVRDPICLIRSDSDKAGKSKREQIPPPTLLVATPLLEHDQGSTHLRSSVDKGTGAKGLQLRLGHGLDAGGLCIDAKADGARGVAIAVVVDAIPAAVRAGDLHPILVPDDDGPGRRRRRGVRKGDRLSREHGEASDVSRVSALGAVHELAVCEGQSCREAVDRDPLDCESLLHVDGVVARA